MLNATRKWSHLKVKSLLKSMNVCNIFKILNGQWISSITGPAVSSSNLHIFILLCICWLW